MSPRLFMMFVFITLILLFILQIAALERSLRRTLYSFKNALLVGGLLFVSVLELAMVVEYFVGGGAEGQSSYQAIAQNVLSFPGRFANFAVPVMTVICILLAISNVELMKHEGRCLSNMLSLLLALFYVGGTVLIYATTDLIYDKVIVPRGLQESETVKTLFTYIPIFMLFVMSYFECVFFGVVLMGAKAAKHIPAYDKDYIIVLGCSIDKRGGLLPLLKGRTNKAIRFAWDQEVQTGKPVKFVPSGGQGSNEVISEGSAMELYMITHGAEGSEVFPEKKSRNTFENFLFSKKVIDDLESRRTGEKAGENKPKVAFATTNYHVYRSGILARKAGFDDIEGIASDTKWYFWPNGFIREFFAVLVMTWKVHLIVIACIAAVCLLLHYGVVI